ncbi:MAG TPA: hypothetical protein VIF82_06995 [Burkholderiaceae bacterium]|jgi:hypothetical protein
MENNSFASQIRRNIVALLSLTVAVTALFYNTWRNESTEKNRNIRVAEFEILKNLGELQQIIDFAHFRKDQQRGDLTIGLNRVLLIHDLAALAPKPVEDASDKLLAVWRMNDEKLNTSLDAASALSEQVLVTRRIVLESLRSLK